MRHDNISNTWRRVNDTISIVSWEYITDQNGVTITNQSGSGIEPQTNTGNIKWTEGIDKLNNTWSIND